MIMVRMPPDADPAPPGQNNVPTLPLMHAAFVLAGLGTLLLGPILPLLSARWQLKDSQSGLLLLAQFLGATLGGATVSKHLERGLLLGLSSASLGLFAFASAPSLPTACAALVVAGFGIGRTVAAINIIAGNRYKQNRGSALSWLNFSWSAGALLSPLAAASLAARFALSHLLAVFAALFLLVALAFALQLRLHAQAQAEHPPSAPTPPLALRPFLFFATLILLYGGLETALSAWLTTFAMRETVASIRFSQLITVLLLAGLTGGRALSGVLLRVLRDSTLQRVSLALVAVLIAWLAVAHHTRPLALLAVILGVSLAPIFPATFAILMARRPTASQAGIALAASGIGAAAFPALMGLISTSTGSLRIALSVPVALALGMFLLTALPPARTPISEASASV